MTAPAFVIGNGSDAYRRVFKLQLLALLPVSLAAVLNSGYQFLRYLEANPDFAGDGLRARMALALAGGDGAPGIFDYVGAGLAFFVPTLLVALVVGGFWERIVAAQRGRAIESGFIPAAILFTLLLPGAASFWHVVFGISCAILLGKAIFGGDGKSFLNPALLGFAIVQVSFPSAADAHPLWQGLSGYAGSEAIALFDRGGVDALAAAGIDLRAAIVGSIPGGFGTTSILAVALGAALLLAKRIISWRLLVAQILGLAVVATLFNLFGSGEGAAAMPAYWHLLLGGFAFAAVFLACDPVASAATNPGRWIQGFLVGALVVLIRVANSTHPDAVVPVLLLVSLLAPLIDHAVIAWNIRQRSQRHV